MNYLVRIRPLAQRDVRRAFSWYERLSENLYAYHEVLSGVRRAIVRRFPYAVFYLIAEEEVRVLSVQFEQSVSSQRWTKRSHLRLGSKPMAVIKTSPHVGHSAHQVA